ncbi:MAG TPA: tyrosine-type recombinase/integrase [Longimicrobiaceae bacterium]
MTTPRPRKARTTLYTGGRRGDRVRVLVDTKRARVEVLYRDIDGVPRKRVFPHDRQGREEAVAWAETFRDEREQARREQGRPAPISTRALWHAYVSSPAWANLRHKSQVSYRDRWRKWEEYIGRDAEAGRLKALDIDQFITAATKAGIVINQIRQVVNVARTVYKWGQSRELLAGSVFAVYRWKQPRDAKVLEPEEYTAADWRKLLAKLEPQHPRRWRLAVLLLICHSTGQRMNAVQHLRWRDINPDAGTVTWPKEWQKQGVALTRPLLWDMVAALETARYWRLNAALGRVRRDRKAESRPAALAGSDWVLFAQNRKGQPVSYSSMHTMLRALEARAKVRHRDYRAFHGFRRKVVGDVGRRTGNLMLGLEYVGDRDPKMLKHYDRRQVERIVTAAAALEGEEE